MKRLLLAIFTFVFLSLSATAAHIIGGEMRYTYIGPGSAPNSKVYKITLLLFRGDDPASAAFAASYVIGIFNNDNGQKIIGTSSNSNWLITQDNPPGIQSVPIIFPLCIQGAPSLNYTYTSYSMTIELPDNLNGYTAAYQTCCRINGLNNVGNGIGSTYECIIPGLNQLPIGNDSSPQFNAPVNVICKNAPFTLNFSAADSDIGDSLVYSFCDALNGGAAINASFSDPAPPPYSAVSYTSPYNSSNPFGTGASINSKTGVISGLAPDFGKYVISVCITIYRNKLPIASHRKDLIVQVSDCVVTVANPIPDFVTCDGFNVQFYHTSTGASTVFWDFGIPSLSDDTSNLNTPSFVFPDTGTYNVKFIINKGTGCADSVIRKVGVYPGFFPGFITKGICFSNPIQFVDTTNSRYGIVNSWRWNFGDPSTLADSSRLQNPQWSYSSPGPKNVSLIVTNSKGCVDTAQATIDLLDKPIITLAFRDTLICKSDAVQLNASGTGIFSWTPLANIINANTSSPTVNPPTTTWYHVNLNDNGCVNQDSVRVRVVGFVTLVARKDTIICQGDAVQLNAVSDGLQFSWAPGTNLNNTRIINPIAITNNTTTYTVTATIGSCRATDDVIVTTIPYPIANAGVDQLICYNTVAQLNASIVGTSFTWSPSSYLNNSNILNPIASPPRTTQYILAAYDILGCPKPGFDSVIVNVLPKVRAFAGRDTIVVVGQPLQFNGTGGVNYFWSPPTGLSSVTISNPIGIYNASLDSIKYKLVVTDAIGCADSAYVTIRIFKTNPYVFVPSGFTPNNDGLNDAVRPIAVGIERINYFSIYNRWGQLVFTTTINGKGWDGKINGVLQNSGVFVWVVNAVEYTGKSFFQKGTVALIR